jgi:hypothetical protein
MGTATQSTKDIQDARVLKRLVKASQRTNLQKADLNRILGRATAKALKSQELAAMRDSVLGAVAKQIKKDILPKFTRWETRDQGKRSKWPFKTKRKKRQS